MSIKLLDNIKLIDSIINELKAVSYDNHSIDLDFIEKGLKREISSFSLLCILYEKEVVKSPSNVYKNTVYYPIDYSDYLSTNAIGKGSVLSPQFKQKSSNIEYYNVELNPISLLGSPTSKTISIEILNNILEFLKSLEYELFRGDSNLEGQFDGISNLIGKNKDHHIEIKDKSIKDSLRIIEFFFSRAHANREICILPSGISFDEDYIPVFHSENSCIPCNYYPDSRFIAYLVNLDGLGLVEQQDLPLQIVNESGVLTLKWSLLLTMYDNKNTIGFTVNF